MVGKPDTRRRLLLLSIAALLVAGGIAAAVLVARDHGRGGAADIAPRRIPTSGLAIPFTPDGTKSTSCDEDMACLEQSFGNVAFRSGSRAALGQLVRSTNPLARAGCHRIAHRIGAAGLARHDGDVAAAFVDGSPTCQSGYYHGLLQHAFGDAPAEAVPSVVRTLCVGPKIERSAFLLNQCLHGLGHGVMIHVGYDLPAALQACDALERDSSQRGCHGGVFMENFSASYDVNPPWLRADDPLYPCASIDDRYREVCYYSLGTRLLSLTRGDFARFAQICSDVDVRWAANCYLALGANAASETQYDVRRVLAACDDAGPSWERDCILGAARSFASNDTAATTASRLCRAADDRLQSSCWEGVGNILSTVGPDQRWRERTCRRLAQQRALARSCAGLPPA